VWVHFLLFHDLECPLLDATLSRARAHALHLLPVLDQFNFELFDLFI